MLLSLSVHLEVVLGSLPRFYPDTMYSKVAHYLESNFIKIMREETGKKRGCCGYWPK